MFPQGQAETRQGCPLPPYNTLNFTSANPMVYSTLVTNAQNSPNYPLPASANAKQIADLRANVSYFQSMNQRTTDVHSSIVGGMPNLQYPTFKTEGERLMYRQGQAATAARTALTGQALNAPAGVPLSTIWMIQGGT